LKEGLVAGALAVPLTTGATVLTGGCPLRLLRPKFFPPSTGISISPNGWSAMSSARYSYLYHEIVIAAVPVAEMNRKLVGASTQK
jgi:hypothetical protein